MKRPLAILALVCSSGTACADEAAVTAVDFRHLPKPLSSLLKITPDCSPLDNVEMEQQGVTRITLPGGAALYRVPCWASEQNLFLRWFTIENDLAVPLLFASYSDKAGWSGMAETPNAKFDPATLELAMQGKADASGMCGSSGIWRWQDGQFRMIELRYQPGCDSAAAGDPAHWPVIYIAKGE